MLSGTVHIQDCPACKGSHRLPAEKYETRGVWVMYLCPVNNTECSKRIGEHGRAMVRPDRSNT